MTSSNCDKIGRADSVCRGDSGGGGRAHCGERWPRGAAVPARSPVARALRGLRGCGRDSVGGRACEQALGRVVELDEARRHDGLARAHAAQQRARAGNSASSSRRVISVLAFRRAAVAEVPVSARDVPEGHDVRLHLRPRVAVALDGNCAGRGGGGGHEHGGVGGARKGHGAHGVAEPVRGRGRGQEVGVEMAQAPQRQRRRRVGRRRRRARVAQALRGMRARAERRDEPGGGVDEHDAARAVQQLEHG